MNKDLLFVVAIILILTSCNSTDNKPDYSSMHLDELFNLFLTTQDSLEENSIIPFLDDSIKKYPYRFFYPNERIDSINERIVFELKISSEDIDFDADIKIKMRNLFIFQLNRNDQIIANGDSIVDFIEIENKLIPFIKNENNSYKLPEKRIEIIDLIDTVLVSKAAFIINTQTILDSLEERTNLHTIKKCIQLITTSINNLRNQSAIDFWDKNYDSLNFRKRKIICKLHPIEIWYHPNLVPWYTFNHKPPPPPPLILSKEILDILDDEEEELSELE